MRSFHFRLAAAAAAGAVAGALLGVAVLAGGTGAPASAPQGLGLVADVALGAIVVALLAALWVFRDHVRRLERITAALTAFEREGGRTPLALGSARDGGDEVARLALAVERLAERSATQSAALARAAGEREELLANVAHDLRTPLAAIQGYLELLLVRDADTLGVEARNDLQTAARQAERLGRRVADLFELTRLDDEASALEREDFAFAELAHDAAQRFAAEAARRDVRLEVQIADPAALRTHADLGRIERVLGGLLENALRHTPAGGRVALEAEARDGRVHVAVTDSGSGIPAADLAGVFERHDRAARVGRPDRAGGHGGLGLAIARRIVERHGGTLHIESAPGRGTRVSFDLPSAAPAGAQAGCDTSPAPRAEKSAAATGAPASGRGDDGLRDLAA
jgi:signal transduction histidine kinase